MRLFLIVAVAANGVIGREGELPWHLPEDLRHFKRITLGHPIVMGRLTWESIGRPLPGRRNVVLTRGLPEAPDGVETFPSLEGALEALADEELVFVIGGAGVFREALPLAERVYLTRVGAEVDGDVHFADLDPRVWVRTAHDPRPADEDHAFPYCFEVWERRG